MRSCLSLTQLEWLRRYRPNEIARAALIVGTEDYMNMRLTGRAVTDRTNAAISQLMSLETLDWSDELLSLAGVSRSRLAPIVPSGEPLGGLCESAAQALGLPESAVVACGGHDQYCAALGAGVTDVGDCLLSCGTAWVPLAITDTLVRDPSMRVYPGPHVVPGRWGLLQSVPVAGVVLRWFRDKFCEASSYDALSDAAAQAPAGADGMLFVTAPAGEGGFHFDFVQLRHGRGHFARAIMEGIVCRVRQCLENLSELDTPVTRLVMIGGGARSGLWPRIVADMTGIRTELPEVSEAACRGAAILAGVGAGVFRNISEGMRRFAVRFSTVPSSPEQRAFYAAHYERFVRHATALGLAGR